MSAYKQEFDRLKSKRIAEEKELSELMDEISPLLNGTEVPTTNEDFQYLREVYANMSKRVELSAQMMEPLSAKKVGDTEDVVQEALAVKTLLQKYVDLKAAIQAKFPFVKSVPKTATALYGAAHGAAAAATSEDMFQPQ